ncbi:MAG TPA: PQQ-dependent sugar dehydrogenase [Vicinamibacterales bacterium]
MWTAVSSGVLVLALVTQTVTTRACDNNSTTTPPPSTGGDSFTTRDGARFRVETVFNNVEVPWAMEFAPDGRLFVTERPGRVLAINLTTGAFDTSPIEGVFASGEAGLLGLALDPQFAQTHFVYLYYSAQVANNSGVNRIVRYREVNGKLGERAVLVDNIPASSIHDGGRLKFGPDGLLYATTGDASTQGLAQDISSLAGKILRLNRDGSAAAGNQFSSLVFTYGHRNPQGIAWHPSTGAIWEDEHGNIGNDEINRLQSGQNFGWPRIEGNDTMPGMEIPITFFNPAIAPSGSAFYRGSRIPQFENNLFIATLRGTHLLRVTLDSAGQRIASQERLLDGTFGRLRDVIMGPDGNMYISTNNRDGRGTPAMGDDRILRISPGS